MHGEKHGPVTISFCTRITTGEFWYLTLQRCQEVYMDGTFRTAPRPYYQYLTVHGRYRNRVLCFVHVLMTGKLIGQYRELFRVLKRTIRRASGHRWRPESVISDFEHSLYLYAIETEIPNARLSGCYFHFGQNLWRKVQSLGLARDYRQKQEIEKDNQKSYGNGLLTISSCETKFPTLNKKPQNPQTPTTLS